MKEQYATHGLNMLPGKAEHEEGGYGVEAGIMVGMCGEAAGRPDLIPAFIRMGLTEFSMSPASIPRAKKVIADLAAAGG